MAEEVLIRKQGRIGRITLNRPKALNALSYPMCLAIESALDAWRNDDQVALVLIDAAGTRAFCAGGDIQELYTHGRNRDFSHGQQFWRDEYRLNAKIAEFPKPYVALMQGFTMGGGVGISCHGTHRIVGESSRIAMPECGIGLVPDVGGSLLLARAPGHLGEYLALTATRMTADDAIYAGFADCYVPELKWPTVIDALTESGDASVITNFSATPPPGRLGDLQGWIDGHFSAATLAEIARSVQDDADQRAQEAFEAMQRNSPLSMAVTVQLLQRLRAGTCDIRTALDLEFRYTFRAQEHADFLEGIRAAIIDKDRKPRWRHRALDAVPPGEVSALLAPLGDKRLNLKER